MFGIANNIEFLTAIGVANAPEDVKSTLVAGLENLAQKRLIIRLSDKLTDEKAEEFGKIEDSREAYDWLMTNVPDLPLMMADILEEIKNEALERKAKVAV